MKLRIILAGLLIIGLTACTMKNTDKKDNWKAAHVELKETAGKYRLYVDGKEFYVKGAGCEFGDIPALARHGANAFRTWRVDNGQQTGLEVLELARENGLMVVMGLDIARERHGFDYNDTALVRQQYIEMTRQIDMYKDHPALLAWGLGNELNLRATNPKVWDAINAIGAYIHKVDPNHPTTTMLAGISKADADYLTTNCPEIDFLSVQMYGDIVNLAQRIADAGYTGPYLVTEWGATGHWEVPVTSWNAPYEQSSSEKADAIKYRYESVIQKDDSLCLGSFVFLWGQKQERTPTWYGLFTEKGEETEAIDVMHFFWTGAWPENRSPRIQFASLEDVPRYQDIFLKAGDICTCKYLITDPDEDVLSYRVEILSEATDLGDGGDVESRPVTHEVRDLSFNNEGFTFRAPEASGAYRLFLYTSDGHNHVATINFPFFVN
ncbi:MAG: glycoside hydrolase family 2 TIM barrel-domain containing protein [Bacteroidota bacterium]